jgi:hypothetical protein
MLASRKEASKDTLDTDIDGIILKLVLEKEDGRWSRLDSSGSAGNLLYMIINLQGL